MQLGHWLLPSRAHSLLFFVPHASGEFYVCLHLPQTAGNGVLQRLLEQVSVHLSIHVVAPEGEGGGRGQQGSEGQQICF